MPIAHVQDIDLYYESTGTGDPVLFIHGLGSSGRDWEMQVPAFAERFRVVTCDLRGHGRSSKPRGPYSIPMFAADLAALLRELGAAPAHVVGISLGGGIAFQMAVSDPELIRSLVIVNAGPEAVLVSFRARIQLWQRRLIVRLMGMRKMGEVLADRLLPGQEHATLRQQFADRWAENDPGAYLAAMNALVGWSVADQLARVTCPTLFVASEHDYTPLAAKEAYVPRLPDASLTVIPDARHAVSVERPEAFNEVVLGFLQGRNG